MVIITSENNKLVKLISSLKSRKNREKNQLFIIEGERIISEIPKDNYEILHYVLSEQFYTNKNLDNFNLEKICVVSDFIFKKISDTENSQGILAICKIKNYNEDEVIHSNNKHFVLLDRIMDPGNLGTIIRTAEALGLGAIFLSKGCVDLYNPKVLRATMGSIFHIPLVQDCDFKLLIEKLKKNKISIVSSYLNAKSYVYNENFKGPCAIVIGNEANGISQEIIDKSDKLVKIPMYGKVDSINASIAASIIFYEIAKQKEGGLNE